jgi:hypothetical protein
MHACVPAVADILVRCGLHGRSPGSELSASRRAWPGLIHLEHLCLYSTRVTTRCLPGLEHCLNLTFLDVRCVFLCVSKFLLLRNQHMLAAMRCL